MMDFKVDKEKCIQCKLCVSECPVLIINGKTDYPEIKDSKEELCIKCQHCLAVCPTGSISIWGKEPEDSVAVNVNIPGSGQLEQLIKTRRSIRRFKEEELDKDLIHHLLTTAAYAPTAKNDNAVMFSVVDDKKELLKLRDLAYENIREAHKNGQLPGRILFLNNFQELWYGKQIDVLFRNAPHLLVASAPRSTTNPRTDSIIALSYFELLANSHGLGTLWNGYAKWALNDISPEIRKKMGIPEDHIIAEVILFGKPAIKFARSIQSEGLNLNMVEI